MGKTYHMVEYEWIMVSGVTKKTKRMKKQPLSNSSNNGQKSSEIMFKIYFKHFLPFLNTSNLCLAHLRHYRSFAILGITIYSIAIFGCISFPLCTLTHTYTPISVIQNLLKSKKRKFLYNPKKDFFLFKKSFIQSFLVCLVSCLVCFKYIL